MFVLLAGPRVADGDGLVERMAAGLRGGNGQARFWVDSDRGAAAASVKPWFVPEDAYDVQPLASAERLFVCQARLDNRAELIERLRIPDDEPVADSAVLAAAYERWGAECVHEVVGDYAFAAWHRGEGRIVAAVDPIGMRRLFWARVNGGLVLSAQLPALLAHPQVSKEPDFGALASLLDAGIDRTVTPFAAVRAVPGGHILRWHSGEVRVERWWRPDYAPSVWHKDPGEYVEELRELFTRAVAAQLRSSTPVSSMLSGGLDSGCVTAMAARLLPSEGGRVTAYTSVPEQGLALSRRPNWEPDDGPYAAETAACYENVDHRLVRPGGLSTLDAARRLHERSSTPAKSATNLLWLDAIGTSVASAGSRVLLVGQQGNAAFSWRGNDAVWELTALGKARTALTQLRLEAQERETTVTRVAAGVARRALRSLSGTTLGAMTVTPARKFVRSAYRPKRAARGNEYALTPAGRRFWATFATTPRHVFWAEPVLQWGIEWRDPTADRRLLERLLRFPQAAFRPRGRDRGLARALAADLLPDRVRLRRTQGAQAPEAPSLIAAHAPAYESAVEAMRASAACRELLDLDLLDQAIDTFRRGCQDYGEALALDRALGVGTFLLALERRP